MARLFRDSYGVPHLRGDSVLDLARAQGRVSVRDRAWQMEWLRLRGSGTTTTALGDSGAAWDDFARRMRLVETAERALAACDPETQCFVEAYVDGVNAELAVLDPASVPEFAFLGMPTGAHYRPKPWQSWTPLAGFLAQHLLFGSLGLRLWERLSRGALGADAQLLSHEGPFTSGSNAWAVGGARTASGFPLIGGDPHRAVEQPGVYQQIRLTCADADDAFDVVGLCFLGVPGIHHFAHAGEVAWAITNACADYQDLLDVESGDPLPDDLLELQRGLAVRTSSWMLGDLGFDAFLPLLRARSVEDVDAAFDRWVEPVNNAVIADRAGALRYRIAGKVPVRDGSGSWVGWLADPNRSDHAPDGEIITANDRRGPESASIGSVFAPRFRADRIRELLAGRAQLTTADFVAIHNDSLLPSAAIVTRLVPDGLDGFDGFDGFDGQMLAGSAEAGRYAAFRSALVRRIAAHPALDPLRAAVDDQRHGPLFAPLFDVTYRVGLSLPKLADEALAGRPPYGIDLFALAAEALTEVDAAGPITWGETHLTAQQHALAVIGFDPGLPVLPLDGDLDCVRSMASYPAMSDAASKGSIARYVWDLDDRTAGGWIVPTGASGLPGDHLHDQLPLWAAGELAPIVTAWDELAEEALD